MIPTPAGLSHRPYQEEGIRFAAKKRAVLIGDEMGLGKTVQAIGICGVDNAESILVICPATLKLNWVAEFERWGMMPWKVGVVRGSKWPEGCDVVIVNYDVLTRHSDKLHGKLWDVLICDECHYLKSPEAKRTKAVLARGGIQANRKVFMSGTPMVNKPIELWPILASLSESFGTYHEFGMRYCGAEERPVQYQQVEIRPGQYARKPVRWAWFYDGATNLDELHARLKGFMIRRKKADVLKDLPPKTRQVIEIGTSKAKVDKAEWRAAVNALEHDQTQIVFDKLSATRHEQALEKTPRVVEHILDALSDGRKIIVFAHHKDVIQAIGQALKKQGIQAAGVIGGMSDTRKQAAVNAFQSDVDVRVFLGSIYAAGTGLTLTAASHVIFAELDWVPGIMSQAEDRAHRIGQHNAVLVQHLVWAGSLDARIARKLVHKQDILDRTLDGLSPERNNA